MLFREEVFIEKKKLQGEVLLVQPLSFSVLSYLLMGIVGIVFILLFWGSYARTESVLGYLVPTKGFIKIFPDRVGIISKIYVTQGSFVKKGQEIAFIDVTMATSSGKTAEEQSLIFIGNQISSLQQHLLLQEKMVKVNIQKVNSGISSQTLELVSLNEQLGTQKTITNLSKIRFKNAQILYAKGSVSRSGMDKFQEEYLRNLRQKQTLSQNAVILNSKIENLRYHLKEIPLTTSQNKAKLKRQIDELSQRKSELEGRRGYLLRAPISGTVTAFNIHVGKGVNSRLPLLAIIPEGSKLVAELFIPSRAIGFVKKGQEVRLLFDAFPYQRFGSFPAVISNVSGAIMAPNEIETPFELKEATYKVSVNLKSEHFTMAGTEVSLQTGMQLTGNIILERRSFMDWLLEPIRSVGNRVK
jgi:membrane fusion protein